MSTSGNNPSRPDARHARQEYVWSWGIRDDLGHDIQIRLSRYGRIHHTIRCGPRLLKVDADMDASQTLRVVGALLEAVGRAASIDPAAISSVFTEITAAIPGVPGLSDSEIERFMTTIHEDHPGND
jgi:hypothetical protein